MMVVECARCGREMAAGEDDCPWCGFDPLGDPSRFGHYELLDRLGRGGLSAVFKARKAPPLKLRRPRRSLGEGGNGAVVALKVLASTRRELVARFVQEAAVAARLRHPNLVPVLERGVADDHPFLAMEFVDGPSMAALIARRALAVEDAVRLAAQVSCALDYVHGQGYLHRDITPGNILIASDGSPRLTDFGLVIRREESGRLAAGVTAGTPVYMSPEQAGGHHGRLDARSDVYALGAVLYHAVTGRPPFSGPDVMEILRSVQTVDPPLPPDLDPQLGAIIRRAMEKDPERRYPSMLEFGEALEAWARRGQGAVGMDTLVSGRPE